MKSDYPKKTNENFAKQAELINLNLLKNKQLAYIGHVTIENFRKDFIASLLRNGGSYKNGDKDLYKKYIR
jgi:hypothetical protein